MKLYPTRRVAIELHANVLELPGDKPVYVAIVTNATGDELWRSVPLPTWGVAEYLGWRHMAWLAMSLQAGDPL